MKQYDKVIPSHSYEEWDTPESNSEVFNLIKSGKMNESGFKNWVDQVKIDETRYLFPM